MANFNCQEQRLILKYQLLGLLVCIRECSGNPFCEVITEQKDCSEKPDPASAGGMPKNLFC